VGPPPEAGIEAKGESMTVLNRIGDRLASIVLPKADAGAIGCGAKCFCSGGHVYAYSCLNHGCVWTAQRC
jgi:hypothetical protein